MGLVIAETEGEEAGYDTESPASPSVLSYQNLRALKIIPALSSLAVPHPRPHDAEWSKTIEQTTVSPVRHQKITRPFLLLCQQIPSFKET